MQGSCRDGALGCPICDPYFCRAKASGKARKRALVANPISQLSECEQANFC